METKNVYIILVVVVVLAGGFFFYRNHKKDKDLAAHEQDTYVRLTEMSNKSPRTGLVQMGKALKAYYAVHKSYPESLDALYPDQVPVRMFIDNVNWDYRPAGDNFYLGKTVTAGGRTLMASTDATLKARMGTSTTAVAAVSRPKASPGGAGGSGSVGDLKLPSGTDILAALQIEQPAPEPAAGPKDIAPVRIEPRTISEDETQQPSYFAARVSRTYLVWRDAAGHMGFGNVQYPHAERIAVAAHDRWFHVDRKGLVLSPDLQEPGGDSSADAAIGDRYLVWKYANGHIGYGNVQYPASRQIAIAAQNRWLKNAALRSAEASSDAATADALQPAGQQREDTAIFRAVGSDYLVWKDKSGVIGIGNVQLPDPVNIASILVDGRWQAYVPDSTL